MILTKQSLESMTCANPECSHDHPSDLYFHSSCHPKTPTWCVYDAGVLRVICAECNSPVAHILVA